MVVHEGVIYSCDQCYLKFTQQFHLKRHKESVHEGIVYSCDLCGHKSKRQDHLKEHKRSHKKEVHDNAKFISDDISIIEEIIL